MQYSRQPPVYLALVRGLAASSPKRCTRTLRESWCISLTLTSRHSSLSIRAGHTVSVESIRFMMYMTRMYDTDRPQIRTTFKQCVPAGSCLSTGTTAAPVTAASTNSTVLATIADYMAARFNSRISRRGSTINNPSRTIKRDSWSNTAQTQVARPGM